MGTRALDKETIEGISRLSFGARRVVEGMRSGQHRSPLFGSSVEFAEHKEYAPGDDLRHLDWKLFAKADRYYVKRFEEETNLTCYLLVDQSASMTYVSSGLGQAKGADWRGRIFQGLKGAKPGAMPALGPYVPGGSKLAYSTLVAASLAYLLIGQGDRVGLITFGGGAPQVLAPRSQASHLHALVEGLIAAPKPGKADLAKVLQDAAPRLGRRQIIVVLSDFLDDLDGIFRSLKGLGTTRHDIILFQTLDHDELTFPFEEVSRFEDPEDRSESLLSDPKEIRDAYLEELGSFLEDVRQRALAARVDHLLMDTSEPVSKALSHFLRHRRGGAGRKGARR